MWYLRKKLNLFPTGRIHFPDDQDPDPDPAKKDGGGGGGDPDPKPKEDAKYTVKVDGQDRTFTLDELKEAAGKSAGADVRFEQAAEMRKTAAKGTRLLELADELRDDTNPPTEKTNEFLNLLGLDPSKVASTTPKGNSSSSLEAGKKVGFEGVDSRIQAAVKAIEEKDLNDIRESVEDETRKGVDKDDILGKMVGRVPEDKRNEVKNALYDMAIQDVRDRIFSGQMYGPEMLQSSLQRVRALVEKLGIPAKAVGHPPVSGPSPLGVLSPQVTATEPIKRVSSTETNWEQNAVDRIHQRMVQAMRADGK